MAMDKGLDTGDIIMHYQSKSVLTWIYGKILSLATALGRTD
jgi:methionyl-tRNA formyltransferase